MNLRNIFIGSRRLARLLVGFSACCGLAAALPSCSNIDEADRLIYVEPAAPIDTIVVDDTDELYDAPIAVVPHGVLIEDHTGQRCPNCPEASKLIHDFQQLYGPLVVPVAIHSQAQGIMEPEGLGNELGNELYNQWKLTYKPAGLFNRFDFGGERVLNKDFWMQALQYVLPQEAALDIRVKASKAANSSTADIDVKVLCTRPDATANGKLMVWLTEDNIMAPQDSMGTIINNYVHNHVLRAAINSTSGDNIALRGAEGDNIVEHHYKASLKEGWKPQDLSVVAFVCNDSEGVLQVVSRKLKTK